MIRKRIDCHAHRCRRGPTLSPRDPARIVDRAARSLDSFRKLDPRVQIRNPVMFVVFIGSIFTTVIGIGAALGEVRRAKARRASSSRSRRGCG